MKDFKPKLPLFPYMRMLIALCVFVLVDIVFNDNSPSLGMFAVSGLYVVGELSLFGYKRYKQVINHRRLKSYGLSVAWMQHPELHEIMKPIEFMHMWEHSLCNDSWRNKIIEMLQQAEFYCVYDTLVTPNRLRWNLDIKLQDEMSEDEKLSVVITLMTGLPEDQPWRVYREDDSLRIETYMYEIEGAVTSFDNNPAPALHFWSVFQNDLVWLLDQAWVYNKPQFKQGVVDHIWFELPAKFALPNNGILQVEEAGDKIKATTFDSNGKAGESQLFHNASECWAVWRHAVVEPPLE